MKHKIKVLLTVLLVLATVAILAGCKGKPNHYTINDEDGYTVSVQYHTKGNADGDTKGGEFDAGTYVLTDCYKAKAGQELMLLDPSDSQRSEPKQAKNPGYFLAGWYTECKDTGAVDENGQPVYTYSGYWDFDTDTFKVEGDNHSSSEPVLHLYAAWVPNFAFEVKDLTTGEVVDTILIDPTKEEDLALTLSVWDQDTGRLNKKDIPVKEGYTFNGLYLDKEGTQKVTEESVRHSGTLDLESAKATDPLMTVYVDYVEGSYVAVYTAQDFVKQVSNGKDVMVMADLDFAEVEWDSFISNYSFSSKIIGNGHKLSNITLKFEPENVNGEEFLYTGLFGMLEETALICDLSFENVKFTVAEGRKGFGSGDIFNDISIGLLTGQITEGARVENVTFANCVIELDVTIENYDYTLGLVAASGADQIDSTGITVTLIGEGSENLLAELVDGIVKVVSADAVAEAAKAA